MADDWNLPPGLAGDGESATSRAGIHPVPIEVLTDEELAVLVPPGAVAVSPHLDERPEAERDVARRTAYRSLLARGILSRPTPQALEQARDAGTGEVELMIRDDVRALVALRNGPNALVAVSRFSSAGEDFWYSYVVEDVVLLEQVTADGLHHFALSGTDYLPELLEEAVLHPDAVEGVGTPVTLPVQGEEREVPPELVAQLGESLLRTDVIIRSHGDTDPPFLGLFSGPSGTHLTRVREGVAPVTEPVTPEHARSALREALSDAVSLRQG